MPDTIYDAWASGAGWGGRFEGSAVAIAGSAQKSEAGASQGKGPDESERTIRQLIERIDLLRRLVPDADVHIKLQKALAELERLGVVYRDLDARHLRLVATLKKLNLKVFEAHNEIQRLRKRIAATENRPGGNGR